MNDDLNNVPDAEEIDNIVSLTDEDGNEIEFEFLDLIQYDGEEYVVLLPTEDSGEDAGEVVILKLEDTEDENQESYVSVDDEEILNEVFQIFKEKFKDEFNFIDDENND
ncbi:MAG: DUF1292 domain-containing protein [Clostridia bacterium]|jgi:uncharacterized protein YrzB (UPF0473 family)|nr:putative uncharacterized protein [Clostridium sp. CAG:571]HJJ07694.1 DUF1292 domain-containing protein [Clostridiaceae bacterium]HJJ14484.1 DUF1292 domain-containing protein [Clostridiaceae bacterium]